MTVWLLRIEKILPTQSTRDAMKLRPTTTNKAQRDSKQIQFHILKHAN